MNIKDFPKNKMDTKGITLESFNKIWFADKSLILFLRFIRRRKHEIIQKFQPQDS